MKAVSDTHKKNGSEEQLLPCKGQMTWIAFLWTYCTLSACGGIDPGCPGEILILQSPPYLRVAAGKTVVMHCNFSLQSNITSMFVEWNQEEQKLIECRSGSVGCTQGKNSVTVNRTSQFSTLHIRSIEPKDNGTYYCKIQLEKPAPIRRGCGNGTILDVTEPEASADTQMLLPGLLASGVIFCLLCTMYNLWKGNKLTGMRSESPSNNRGVDRSPKSAEDKDLGILQPVYISTPIQQPARTAEQAIYSEI